jgi:hypothetical protein
MSYYENDSNNEIEVVSPSGAMFTVASEGEKEYFENVSRKYISDNHFINISDLQDLDRVLIMELMCWRWGLWLSREHDYEGNPVDSDLIKKAINDYSKELRLLKKSLGMDKATRDKEKGESVADYIENLRLRAKEFGVTRNKQAAKAITLFQELKALIVLHDNCTEDERKENHATHADIVDWVKSVIPEFDEIDEEFKKTSQKYWIREV